MTTPHPRHLRAVPHTPTPKPCAPTADDFAARRARYLNGLDVSALQTARISDLLDVLHQASLACHRCPADDLSWMQPLLQLSEDELKATLATCVLLANLDQDFFTAIEREAHLATP